MKVRRAIMLVALLAAASPVAVYLAANQDALRQKNPSAITAHLTALAEEIAYSAEARQFVSGFSHSGLESIVTSTVDASGDVARIAVYDTESQRFSYPVHGDPAPNEQARIIVAVPIRDDDTIVGRIEIETTESLVASRRRQIIITAVLCLAGGLAIGLTAASIVAKRFSQSLNNMEPEEITSQHAGFVAMTNSLHEGVLAIDQHEMISMSNQAARRLLGMKGRDLNARHIRDIVPDTGLPRVLASGLPEYNREQEIHGRIMITNRVPIVENKQVVGAMAIFQDKSNIVQLAEELTGARQLVDTLRAASHEFRNKLHVILGLIERGHIERAKEYIIDIQNRRVELSEKLDKTFADPVVSALILGKCISCGEQGVMLDISQDSRIAPIPDRMLNHALVTIVGNLIDNAMESARTNHRGDGRIELSLNESESAIVISVADNGPGVPAQLMERIFERGFSTKGDGHGIGLCLVSQVTESAGGKITLSSARGKTVFSVHLPK